MNAMELLREYMLTPAGCGYEAGMAHKLQDSLRPFADQIHIDKAGNVIARIEGSDQEAPCTMLFAHMDQVGFVVTNVDANGYLRVNKNGSVPDKLAPGCALLVRTVEGEYIPGVISERAYHIMTEAEKSKVEPIPSLYVDIGVKSKERAKELGVLVGCSAQYQPHFARLDGTNVTGTAIDNRGGCVALVICAERLAGTRPKATTYLVGTVQEEHNLRGAICAANAIQPDIAICLDVCLASDAPGLEQMFDAPTGAGPVINLYSFHGRGTLNGVIAHEGLVRLAQRTAGEEGIPVNRFASRGILTDATYIQNMGDGVATIDLSFPAKYTHSPCEVCDVADIERLGLLCAGMISRIDRNFPLNRYV